MSKKQLITDLHRTTGLTIAECSTAVDGVFGHIAGSLQAGNKVVMPGLGTLSVSVRAARSGRNPATGEAIDIPEKNAIKFKAAKSLLEAIN